MTTRVVVAMSGGVDSSVAAALLVEQGYEVIGIMLRLWAEDGAADRTNRCCAPEAVADARAIAHKLDIPFYDVHAEAVFKQKVVDPWVAGHAAATTPNPCFNCNRSIRFGFLMQRARALGAEYLATGHYARVRQHDGPGGTQFHLLKGADAAKDQSYVLHVLGQADLSRAMFPCGEYTKSQVRDLARGFGLLTAERPESQDLCFLTRGDYRGFLSRQAPDLAVPGPILNTHGDQLGVHAGLSSYTVGQRRGLHVAPNGTSAQPLYVLRLDPSRNALIVGPQEELGATWVGVSRMHYCAGVPIGEPLPCHAKVRYKAREAPGMLIPLRDGGARFAFDAPQRDAAPGQGMVAYDGERVIGGGVISAVGQAG